jgi:hypothetical protein
MEQQNRITGIIGRKGAGKSRKAREILQCTPRLFVFDTMGEHEFVPNTCRDLQEAEEFLAWAEMQGTFAGRFVPDDDIEGTFTVTAQWVYEQGEMLFAVEEIPLLCRPGFLPPELGRLVRLGRHHDVSLLWTAQRAAEVSRTLTAMTDVFILFSNTEPRDLDAIADRCGSEIAIKVSRLPLHGYVVWDVIARHELDNRDIDSWAIPR